MKKTIKKPFAMKNKVIMSIAAAMSLIILISVMINYIYVASVEQCYEDLGSQTSRVKSNLYMQMQSDSEQLKTIANFAASISENEELRRILGMVRRNGVQHQELQVVQEELAVVFESFQKSGLIDELEVLLPGNVLVTTSGTYDVSDSISFEEEVKHGVHISDSRQGFLNKRQRIIHNAVPVVSKGETIAILMGIIDINKLSRTYEAFLPDGDGHMHLVDGSSGDFIINTADNSFDNVSEVEASGANKEKLVNDIKKGKKGNVAFRSGLQNDYVFASYDTVGINDWRVIVALPEKKAFSEARRTIGNMIFLALFVIIVMVVYIIFLLNDERKSLKLSTAASHIRKLLLEFGQRQDSLKEALVLIADTGNARSSFFVDTDGEQYDYIRNIYDEISLSAGEKIQLVYHLIGYSDKKKREIFVKEIRFNEELQASNPELYELMESHEIKNVVFTAIWDKNDHAAVIGVLNCRQITYISKLLCDIAMCFSMTIYNRKYLDETEMAAITDSLTGLTNRMGFNRDMLTLQTRNYSSIACLYVDVNELHAYNNKYGHLAGDKMLSTVANIIRDTFKDDKVYRWGGDEFIVISLNCREEDIVFKVEEIKRRTDLANYHISVGNAFSSGNTDTEFLLKEAEKKMYEAKAKYYQDKSRASAVAPREASVIHVATGIAELDAAISIMGLRYLGVYAVSLEKDMARPILVPGSEEKLIDETIVFSEAIKEHIATKVLPDYHRAFSSFVNYDVIQKELSANMTPEFYYEKFNGDQVKLSVHSLCSSSGEYGETLWVFEKKN